MLELDLSPTIHDARNALIRVSAILSFIAENDGHYFSHEELKDDAINELELLKFYFSHLK